MEHVPNRNPNRGIVLIFVVLWISGSSCSTLSIPSHTAGKEKPSAGLSDLELVNAVREKDLSLVRNMLSKGHNVNTTDQKGSSILTLAVMIGSPEIIELLLEFKADPNLAEGNGGTPLEAAVVTRNEKAFALLIEHGARIELPIGRRPLLSQAISQDSLAMVERLLNAGADPNVKDRTGEPALSASVSHDMGFVISLLKHGATPNIYDEVGWSPLLESIRLNNPEKVSLLLNYGADVNHRDRDGWTAYNEALLQGCPEIVAELEKAGAVP